MRISRELKREPSLAEFVEAVAEQVAGTSPEKASRDDHKDLRI